MTDLAGHPNIRATFGPVGAGVGLFGAGVVQVLTYVHISNEKEEEGMVDRERKRL